MNNRTGHRIISYILLVPVTLTGVTGLLYSFLDMLGVDHKRISFLMSIHQMSFLFPNSSVVYTLVLFSLVLLLVYFGLRLVNYSFVFNSLTSSNPSLLNTPTTPSSTVYIQGRQQVELTSNNATSFYENRVFTFIRSLSQSRSSVRSFHHRLAAVVFIVLLFMATTGFTYRFLRNAVGIEKSKVKWIIHLHSMKFLPSWLSFIWVALVFTIIATLFISGIRLIIKTRRRIIPSTPARNSSSVISRRRIRNTNSMGSGTDSNPGSPFLISDERITVNCDNDGIQQQNTTINTFLFTQQDRLPIVGQDYDQNEEETITIKQIGIDNN